MSELLYEKQGMIAKIIINRPEKRNALNSAVIHGIDEALKQAAEDPKVRVVILGGAGEKAFTSSWSRTQMESGSVCPFRCFGKSQTHKYSS